MTITMKTGGDAHRLLEDFLKYAKRDPEAMADHMQYDHDGFRMRLRDLEQVVKDASESRDSNGSG